MSSYKVIFMGTPEFAIPSLLAFLKDSDFEVQAVITQEDKKIGRKQILTPPPVKIIAKEHSIPVFQPAMLKNNKEFMALIEGLRPDFIVVVAYGKILPKTFLEIPKYGCINLHPSLLPRYRGASPIEEALLHGDTETGLSFIRVNEKMDSGDILLVQRVMIQPEDTTFTLKEKLWPAGAVLFPFLLKEMAEGLIEPIPQQHEKAVYCKKLSKADGFIDPAVLTAEQILNHIRAYIVWPSSYMYLAGKLLKLLQVRIFFENNFLQPGQLKETDKNQLLLGTANGELQLIKVQLEGKKPLLIEEFLRGNRSLLQKAAYQAESKHK